MTKSRASFSFSSLDANGKPFVTESGVNLGDLKDTKHKGQRLFRECVEQLEKAIFRIYGPKTFLVIESKDFQDRSFTLTGSIAKPVHGKERTFEVLTPGVTVEFSLPSNDEEVEAA